MLKSREDLVNLQQKSKAALAEQKMCILVCAGTGCVANGSLKVYESCLESCGNGVSVKVNGQIQYVKAENVLEAIKANCGCSYGTCS